MQTWENKKKRVIFCLVCHLISRNFFYLEKFPPYFYLDFNGRHLY
jgi:hypothetical protein